MDQLIHQLEEKGVAVHKIGSEAYERSVATANLLYRFFRPACVVQPKDTYDVQTVIEEARKHGFPITIKNGGHSYAGFSTAKEGISLDLALMNRVKLNIDKMTVTMQGGALWGHVYKALVNQRNRKGRYIINGGRCPTVGVSGFILGGGLGPFTRTLGMGCDSLIEATLVTANGELVTVSRNDESESDKGQLFWALRGAGGGNFGVVVEMKLDVKELSSDDGTVVAGQFIWYPYPSEESMTEFMEAMNTFYATNWSEHMTIDSSWLCDLSQKGGDLGVRFNVYYDGPKEKFDQEIDEKPGNNASGIYLAGQLKRRSMPEESTRFLHETLVEQWSEETIRAFPQNKSYSIYSSFVLKNDVETVSKITPIIHKYMQTFRKNFSGEQAVLQATWIHSGGAAADADSSDTAFRWRESVYHMYVMARWNAKWLEHDMRKFLDEFRNRLGEVSSWDGARAAFINFPDSSLAKDDYEKAYYGPNHKKLRQVKKTWDGSNFFNWDQGVQLPQSERLLQGERYFLTNMSQASQPQDLPVLKTRSISHSTTSTGGFLSGHFPISSSSETESGEVQGVTSRANDESFTDKIARQQWDAFPLPPQQENLDFTLKEGGTLRGLTDLGF